MDKMHYPRGLIRNSTQNGMQQNLSRKAMYRRVLRPRVLVYMAVLSAVTLGMLWSLLTRTPLKVDVVRDRGVVARMVGQGQIENVYRLQIMNATESSQQYVLSATGIEGLRVMSDTVVAVDAASARWVPMRLQAMANAAPSGSHPITLTVTAHGPMHTQVSEKSVFLVPR
jgi:polyferredoxin